MNRRANNQRRLEESIRKLFQRGAAGQSQHDITRYKVLIDKNTYLIGERTNEIIEGKTVSTYTAQLDDSGTPFSHVKDFILCSCGCKINIKVHKVHRCFFCKKIVCEAHSIIWRAKDITFCKRPICYISGRFFQLIFYTYQSIKFSISQIFGLKNEPSHPAFPSEKRGVEDSEDNEIRDNDFKDIVKRRDRDFDRY